METTENEAISNPANNTFGTSSDFQRMRADTLEIYYAGHLYQDMYARPVPTTDRGSFHLNLETVYALVVLFIYWEDNIWKVSVKI